MHCIPVATVFVVRSILFCNNGSCIPGLGERDLILESKMSVGGLKIIKVTINVWNVENPEEVCRDFSLKLEINQGPYTIGIPKVPKIY